RGLDVSEERTAADKAQQLPVVEVKSVEQVKQLENPDARVSLLDGEGLLLLQDYSAGVVGIQTGDFPQFGRFMWEVEINNDWEFEASTTKKTGHYTGKSMVIFWQNFKGELAERQKSKQSYVRGWAAFGESGVLVSAMR